MKKVFMKVKFFIPALILSFAISFMLFIYEPITMYANNIPDFWFDFYILIKPIMLFSLLSFIILSVFFLVTYFIAKRFKHIGLYYFALLFATFCFICAYIHSNFLANFLPPLDGTTFDWSDPTANIISILTCIIIAIGIISSIFKINCIKTIKYTSFINLAIIAMLSISLLSTATTTDVFSPKDFIPTSTEKNLNLVSNDKNFMIFLVDAVDSVQFNKIVSNNQDYQNALKDFSYFPDTLSGYTFTRDSIPFILSGEWNENQTTFSEYSTNAYDNSKFFAKLSERNYNKNLYEIDFTWNSNKAADFDNIQSSTKSMNQKAFLKQELKYLLYKSLPFPLKAFSKIDTLNFAAAKQETNNFQWDDINFYHNYLDQPLEKTNEKYFQFIHIEGGHVPFDTDENVNPISEDKGTYPQKLEATMKIISSYINRLQENHTYDNSVIIILADHGYQYDGSSRANPILYIKGINETHNKMLTSDKQISYADLCNTFMELVEDKKSTEILAEIPDTGRIRRLISNPFKSENHMIEYKLNGKAWDANALQPTGKEYNL